MVTLKWVGRLAEWEHMAVKYCEFQPTQHRNKRPANLVFLDDEDDKHPLAICDACALKLKQMRPDAIVRAP